MNSKFRFVHLRRNERRDTGEEKTYENERKTVEINWRTKEATSTNIMIAKAKMKEKKTFPTN